VQWHGEYILTNYITEMFKMDKSLLEKNKTNLNEVLRALLTVEDETFTIEILKHLVKCANEFEKLLKQDNKLYSEVRKLIGKGNYKEKVTDIVFNNSASQNLIKKLEEHSKKYYWKKNNYYSTMFVTPKDVLIEILSIENFDIDDLTKHYNEILDKANKTKERQLFIKRKLFSNLPSYYSNVLEITSVVGTRMSDKRKIVIMTTNGAFDKILKVIADRTDVALQDIKLLIPQELKYFVEAPQEYKERFEERKKSFLVYQSDLALIDELFETGKNEIIPIMEEPYISEGDEVERVLHRLDKRLNIFRDAKTSRKTLQGVTAFYDKQKTVVTGKVRIIKDPKNEIINPGEILVAPSTTPDYVNAMNKCSAIITDWGGLTSHAAIISRELRKPCLINTNYATDILKEGEEIKIDFLTGSIWGGQNSHAAIMSRELSKPCVVGTNYASHVLETGDEIKIDLETGEIEIIEKMEEA
jgi:phosphoenolpyruvate synthase/pyruvate phosphate dikinase